MFYIFLKIFLNFKYSFIFFIKYFFSGIKNLRLTLVRGWLRSWSSWTEFRARATLASVSVKLIFYFISNFFQFFFWNACPINGISGICNFNIFLLWFFRVDIFFVYISKIIFFQKYFFSSRRKKEDYGHAHGDVQKIGRWWTSSR